ncbi:helix-turn-helix domain-containing protein [Streptomyces sp. NPDC088730]|uniref:helix-turn-helix domain-containing protein n=1 Tax=Streptomyces sp. NPDC088730 TaxID=3365877 RepID=UPI0037FC436B
MTPPAVAQRRARVRQLSQRGASLRDIAAEVGVSKDTVRRDIRATAPPDETPVAPVVETPAQRMAHRVAQTETAMRQLYDAAQAVSDATPAHTITDDETAQRWVAQLRDTAAQLSRAADEFATYYPAAVACDTETGVAT